MLFVFLLFNCQEDHDAGFFLSPPPLAYRPSYLDSPDMFDTSSPVQQILSFMRCFDDIFHYYDFHCLVPC